MADKNWKPALDEISSVSRLLDDIEKCKALLKKMPKKSPVRKPLEETLKSMLLHLKKELEDANRL